MSQRILAGRASASPNRDDVVLAKIDQVILAREPATAIHWAFSNGLRKARTETVVAYDPVCIATDRETSDKLPLDLVRRGIIIGRAGLGFAAAVHLERFAAPARLALTDDIRLVALGGVGMLTLLTSPQQLGKTLVSGTACLRSPRSVQVLLTGKLRPFSSVRDAALQLLASPIAAVVARIGRETNLPVILEFTGPSARLLSIPERAVLCSIAPRVGAAGALFVSDDRTEAFLRDQRRSKAFRSLSPDAGAPCDHVETLDLGTVDPLLMTTAGEILLAREMQGKPVTQVVLGGDTGASLREFLEVAALLKSKRVPPTVEFLLAPPSRQVLEVCAQTGALLDLLAAGARIVEPEYRVLTGQVYPPLPEGVSLRSFDPGFCSTSSTAFVASAETLAYAAATGELDDPRAFKRPARIAIPRTLPIDDVLVVRKKAGGNPTAGVEDLPVTDSPSGRKAGYNLAIVTAGPPFPEPNVLLVSESPELLNQLMQEPRRFDAVRAIVSRSQLPPQASFLARLGVICLTGASEEVAIVRRAAYGQVTALDANSQRASLLLSDRQGAAVTLELHWTAQGDEQSQILETMTLTPP